MKTDENDLDAGLDLEQALASVQQAIENERGLVAWVRSRPTSWRFAMAGASALVASVVAIALTGNWALVGETFVGLRPLVLGAYLCVLGMMVIKALRPMQWIESPSKSRALAFAGVLLPFAAALAPLHDSHEIPGQSGYCVLLGVALVAALVAALRILDRGAHSNRRTTMLSVAAAAMAANLALEFHCPIVRATHRWAFHASVGVLVAASYFLLWRVRGKAGRSRSAAEAS